MSGAGDRAAEWIYGGIWKICVGWFRVPEDPPDLVSGDDDDILSFKPSRDFLRYLKLWFWIVLAIVDVVLTGTFVAVAIALWQEELAWLIAPVAVVALILIVVPDIIAFIAIHLRYDTTWYLMSDRTLRIRRGIWTIHETTITFENVQNMRIEQGPVQRAFGIATLVVETAGGGESGKEGLAALLAESGASNLGVIEGITNAGELRDRILPSMRRAKASGLGDEDEDATAPGWTAAHVEVLREIRDAVVGR